MTIEKLRSSWGVSDWKVTGVKGEEAVEKAGAAGVDGPTRYLGATALKLE